MPELGPDILDKYKDVDFDAELNDVADEADYEAQAQAIKDVLTSRDAVDIVGSMELGYVLEKIRSLGEPFRVQADKIAKIIEANPKYDMWEAEAVMDDLFRRADTERVDA